jgi:hypothetical protein
MKTSKSTSIKIIKRFENEHKMEWRRVRGALAA